MITNVYFKNIDPPPRLRTALERTRRALERRLKTFRPESARLEAFVERPEPRDTRYEVSFVLRVKRHTLRSGAQVRRDPVAAVQAASDALLRQLERVKHKLRPSTH